MTVGIIILVAFLVFYLIALYCMITAGSLSDDVLGAAWDETSEENESEKKDKRFQIDAWITVLSIVLFSAGIVVGTMFSTNRAVNDKVPETEVVETVDSTSAPDEVPNETNGSIDILPETETTIHIEETEPVTEPDIPEPTVNNPPEVPNAPVTDETVSTVDPDDVEMLACVIYQEAGGNGSCDNCRRYVADIVLNRVAHDGFPNTIYEVLTQKGQYGRLHWTGIKWPERAKYDVEKEAVARAYRIAEEVLSGQHSKLYGNGYIWQAGFVQGTDGFWCCGHFYGR